MIRLHSAAPAYDRTHILLVETDEDLLRVGSRHRIPRWWRRGPPAEPAREAPRLLRLQAPRPQGSETGVAATASPNAYYCTPAGREAL